MYDTFVGLLKHYKPEDDTICQIIGFKFQSLNQQQLNLQQKQSKENSSKDASKDSNNKDSNKHNEYSNLGDSISDKIQMDSLCLVTAYLLKYKIVDLDLLLPHVIFKN